MKKKFLTALLFLILVVASVVGLTACVHTHNYDIEIILPTCTEQGYTIYKCECGDEYIDNYVEAQHTPKTPVRENEVQATYIEDGGYDEVVYCDKCNEEISRTHIVVSKTIKGTEIYSKSLTVDLQNETLYAKLPNGTSIFKFNNDITVADGAVFYLCSDMFGEYNILTKIASLTEGDNVYYLVVENGNYITVYTVTLRVTPKYVVVFDTCGGSVIDSQMIIEDQFATEPENPNKLGYTFVAWDFDFNTPIIANTTITAIWQANEYDLSVNYYRYGTTDKLTDSYTNKVAFDSMYNVASPVIDGYALDVSIVTGTMNNVNGKTVNVYYTPRLYNIYYELNGGINNNENLKKYTVEDEIILLEPTREGYIFMGWSDNGKIEKGSTGDKTFTATWQANEYDLTVNYYKYGTTDKLVDSYINKVAFDSTYNVFSPAINGYTANTTVINGTMNNVNGKTVNVYYTPIIYDIYYELDGGTNNNENPKKYTVEDEITLLEPTKKGYTFMGWSDDGKIEKGSTGNKTFTATWQANEYDLTVNYYNKPIAHFKPYPDNSVMAESGEAPYFSKLSSAKGAYVLSFGKGTVDGNNNASAGIWEFAPVAVPATGSVKLFKGCYYGIGNHANGDDFTGGYNLNGSMIYRFTDGTNYVNVLDQDSTLHYNFESELENGKTWAATYALSGTASLHHAEDSEKAQGVMNNRAAVFTYHDGALYYSREYLVNNSVLTGEMKICDVAFNGSITVSVLEKMISGVPTGARADCYAEGKSAKVAVAYAGGVDLSFESDKNYLRLGVQSDLHLINSYKTKVVFGGEYSVESPTIDGYTADVSVVSGTMDREGKTINVYYTPIMYDIYYELDGGTNNNENPNKYTVEDEITLLEPTKKGYTFMGWSDDGKIEKGSTGNKTFTATWQKS